MIGNRQQLSGGTSVCDMLHYISDGYEIMDEYKPHRDEEATLELEV